jgi:hypothetical protein
MAAEQLSWKHSVEDADSLATESQAFKRVCTQECVRYGASSSALVGRRSMSTPFQSRLGTSTHLVALHVHYLLQRVLHHFIDVFEGSRYFIDKTGA